MTTDPTQVQMGPPAFDGYPYLATRIGACALRHLAVVPGDWARDRLVDLCSRQAATNQMPTCLVVGPADAVYVDVDRDLAQVSEPIASTSVPYGLPVADRIRLPEDVLEMPEMARRHANLRRFAERHRGLGYIVGDNLEGGRVASPHDVVRLSTGDTAEPGPGLAACGTCGELSGEVLRIGASGARHPGPRVIAVHCCCANHNRCARCGESLSAHRLSAYFWDSAKNGVAYVAAYSALSHRCARPLPSDFLAGFNAALQGSNELPTSRISIQIGSQPKAKNTRRLDPSDARTRAGKLSVTLPTGGIHR